MFSLGSKLVGRGWVLPPRGRSITWGILGGRRDVGGGATGIAWVQARDATQCPTMSPTVDCDLAPNVSSAEAGNWLRREAEWLSVVPCLHGLSPPCPRGILATGLPQEAEGWPLSASLTFNLQGSLLGTDPRQPGPWPHLRFPRGLALGRVGGAGPRGASVPSLLHPAGTLHVHSPQDDGWSLFTQASPT